MGHCFGRREIAAMNALYALVSTGGIGEYHQRSGLKRLRPGFPAVVADPAGNTYAPRAGYAPWSAKPGRHA